MLLLVGASTGPFGVIGMLIVYTGLMLAIVWKSFDMVAEMKNWVFEWIGGSSRSMGENQGQQNHLMALATSAKNTSSSAISTGIQATKKQPGGVAAPSNAGAEKPDVGNPDRNTNKQ